MKLFLHGHATHPDWRMALALAEAQIAAQTAAQRDALSGTPPTLGWVYLTDHYAPHADALLAELRRRWAGAAWVGAVGIGIAANGVEYIDEPALSLMLCTLSPQHFRLFSGVKPLPAGSDFRASVAQVHADPATADLPELIAELAERTASAYVFGGLASARMSPPGRPQGEFRRAHPAAESSGPLHIADGVFHGGLSGVAFDASVGLLSRVTQGCQPIGVQRRVTAVERNVVLTLDGEPALDCLLRDLKVDSDEPRDALPRIRQTLVGLSDAADDGAIRRPGQFGSETRVRHLIGIDPARRAIAVAGEAPLGTQFTFCSRNTEAARRDLVRICAELREELEPDALSLETAMAVQGSDAERTPHPARRIAGAVYVSCSGRGGPHFGAPSAELAIVRHALGDVPLVGFFAAGEIARHHLYGYTGVLTVFTGA